MLPILAAALGLTVPQGEDPAQPILPDGLGVNIHFVDPKPGEMAMLAASGVRWVRMDFVWGATERQKGQYDFSAYERLLEALRPYGIRPLFILDYGNRHYDGGQAPRSEEARQAMARWAAEAARRFRGRGILWEMWNEPNLAHFWKPSPNVEDYIQLAQAVGRAIREAAPGETIIGPATSGIDFAFLEACFKGGLLELWSAVSVHPYRQTPPETAAEDYRRLRLLIARYAPPGKKIPIFSGEWGYSAAWAAMNEDRQGVMLPRQWLTNLSNDVPRSIWYDWHDDGSDPKEPEHHFGMVAFPYHAGRDPVYDPKPGYRAARTLTSCLAGFRFNKRLAMDSPEDFVLLFSKGSEVRLAAWTRAAGPRTVTIPASPGSFRVIGHLGDPLPVATADARGLSVTLTAQPQYLVPEAPNDLLRVAAAWERAPLEILTPPSSILQLSLQNPLSRPLRIRTASPSASTAEAGGTVSLPLPLPAAFPRNPDPIPLRIEWEIEGMGRLAQETALLARHPLRLTILPRTANTLPLRLENPTGVTYRGKIRLTHLEGLRTASPEAPVEFGPEETEKIAQVAVEAGGEAPYRVGAQVEDEQARTVLEVPAKRFISANAFSSVADFELWPDGDAKVASEQTLTAETPPEGPPLPGMRTLRIAYRFDAGWKFIRLVPKTARPIEGTPKAFGLWIHGDGRGNVPRLRFVDSTGQCFQPSAEALVWKGWRYVVFPMNGEKAGHWGGADDGKIRYPIRWDSLFLLDSHRKQTRGAIHLAGPTLIYDD